MIIQPTAQYTDSNFRQEDIDTYRLSIQLRLDGFSFAVINPETKLLLQVIEHKLFESVDKSLDKRWLYILEQFKMLMLDTNIKPHLFKKTIISIDHKEYTLLPQALFSEGREEEILTFNQDIPYPYIGFNNLIPGTDHYLIASFHKFLFKGLEDIIPQFTPHHHLSILQNQINKLHRNKNLTKRCYVSITNRDMHIIVMDKEDLLLCNSYVYTSKEDFVYFILLAYNQQKMNTEEDPLYFLGDISQSSALYNISWQYIRNIHFINKTDELFLGPAFDTMALHQYYSLIHSTLCE